MRICERCSSETTRGQVRHLEEKYEEARALTTGAKDGSKFRVFGKENPIVRRIAKEDIVEGA
jgi:hypothetical protein